MKYDIEIRETLKKTVTVDANSVEDAIADVDNQYNGTGEISLDYDNYYGENSVELSTRFPITNLIKACNLFLTFTSQTKNINTLIDPDTWALICKANDAVDEVTEHIYTLAAITTAK